MEEEGESTYTSPMISLGDRKKCCGRGAVADLQMLRRSDTDDESSVPKRSTVISSVRTEYDSDPMRSKKSFNPRVRCNSAQ